MFLADIHKAEILMNDVSSLQSDCHLLSSTGEWMIIILITSSDDEHQTIAVFGVRKTI